MTKLDRNFVANQSLEDWDSLYRDEEKLLEFLPKQKRARAVATLLEAHNLLKRLAPALRTDPWVPTITIAFGERKKRLSIADFLAAGSLPSIADWLDRRVPKRGPAPTKSVIAQAAFELSEISRDADKGPDW